MIPSRDEFLTAARRTGVRRRFLANDPDLEAIATALEAYAPVRDHWSQAEEQALRAIEDRCLTYAAHNLGNKRVSRAHVTAVLQACRGRALEIKNHHQDKQLTAKRNWDRMRTKMGFDRKTALGYARVGAKVKDKYAEERASGVGLEPGLRDRIYKMYQDSHSRLTFHEWVHLGYAFEAKTGSDQMYQLAKTLDDPKALHAIERDLLKYKGVAQLAPEERQEYEVSIRREPNVEQSMGVIVDRHGNPFSTDMHSTAFSGQGWAIFVLSLDNHLYSASHIVSRFHHSSFLAGAPAAAAGEWVVQDGVVKAITPKSGHYMTSPEMYTRMLGFLNTSGVSLSNVLASPFAAHVDGYVWDAADDLLRRGCVGEVEVYGRGALDLAALPTPGRL